MSVSLDQALQWRVLAWKKIQKIGTNLLGHIFWEIILNLQTYKLTGHIFPAGRPFWRTYKLTNLLSLFFSDRQPNLQTYKLTRAFFSGGETFLTNLQTYKLTWPFFSSARQPNLQTYKLTGHIFPAKRPFHELTNLQTYSGIFFRAERPFWRTYKLQTCLAFFFGTDNRIYKLTNLRGQIFWSEDWTYWDYNIRRLGWKKNWYKIQTYELTSLQSSQSAHITSHYCSFGMEVKPSNTPPS